MYIAGHNSRYINTALAVFDDKDKAQAWAESATRWYGEGHPLYPVTVVPNDVLKNPHPFPDPNGSLEDIFKDIDK